MERYTKKEINNQKQGKSGVKVKTVPGPATGRTSGNQTSKGKQKLK